MQPRFEVFAASRGAAQPRRGTVIQNALVVSSDAGEELIEHNPDLQIIDAKASFWQSVECESKLNVELALDGFAPFLGALSGSAFAFGPLDRTVSFERHFLIRAGEREMYAVRLGRKNWKRKMALKVKSTRETKDGGILVRDMDLNEWSPAALQRVVARFEELAKAPAVVTALPSFFKTKLRSVCVHRQLGTVFGVSLDRCKVVGGAATLAQIEVEFWSQLVPSSRQAAALDEAQVGATHLALCAALEAQLGERGVAHQRTELTKSDWVRGVSRCAS
jgi:hypothetical protein